MTDNLRLVTELATANHCEQAAITRVARARELPAGDALEIASDLGSRREVRTLDPSPNRGSDLQPEPLGSSEEVQGVMMSVRIAQAQHLYVR